MERHEDDSIAVVGGGPAGLAGAEVLARAGHPVTVYDRMPSLGRKLLMAGRGGLNLTHGEPLADFLGRYHPSDALSDAIAAFPPDALRGWCEALGEPTFVGSSGRVFPKSFKASPLLRAWLARLDGLGVSVRPRHRFVGFAGDGLAFATPEGERILRPRATLLALGGASWPRLGSDGAWVAPLREAGIPVASLEAANAGFAVPWSEHFRERFAGAPLKRIALRFGGAAVRGEALVTSGGLEGGAVYALSRALREELRDHGETKLSVDLRPDLSQSALTEKLGTSGRGDSTATRLRKAAGLSPVAAGLVREACGNALPQTAPALAALIKDAPLRLTGMASLDRAISSAGGVRFAGLDGRFMLRDRPGTFAAGEMLDWEAPTGGYLLQGAFASGRAAAEGMLAWLAEAP